MYDISSYARTTSSVSSFPAIWIIISIVVAIIGGIAIYFAFLTNDNGKKLKGFWLQVYNFFTFKFLMLEVFLKLTYLILAIYVTLSAFAVIGTSFIVFLLQIVVGNIVLRAVYELLLLQIQICKNTTEINNKLKK